MKFRDYTEIVFESGNILSAKMLEETYRYPRDFLKIFHNRFCNGIVAGLDFETRSDGVYLTAGIVKIDDRYYILSEDMNLDEWLKSKNLQSQEYLIFLIAEDVSTDLNSGISAQSRITLKIDSKKPANSLLLGKYKFRSDMGIRLPNLNLGDNPFEEFTQASFLQLLEVPYAHPQGELAYHPLIFRAIQAYLEQKSPLSPFDFTLLVEIQNHGILSKSTLKSYVAIDQKISSIDRMTNEEFFLELIRCIQKPYQPVAYTESNLNRKNNEIQSKSQNQNKLI